MRSEALDIVIEGREESTWLILSGPFHKEQIPNIRSKFDALLEDRNRDFIVDLEGVTAIEGVVAEMFLLVLNEVREKGGEIRFIFKNSAVEEVFSPYRNLMPIFADVSALAAGGVLRRLARSGRILRKKTGVRISRQVAIFLLIVLCGWFLTLLFIVHLQYRRLAQQQQELNDLTQWKQRATIELTALRERLQPLEQLGIVRDTIKE
jgi:anti-anti-sigma regulatory factor